MEESVIDQWVDRIKQFYRLKYENAAGGLFHVVFDDGNVDDVFVDDCIEIAKRSNDIAAVKIGKDFKKLTIEEREKVWDHLSANRFN